VRTSDRYKDIAMETGNRLGIFREGISWSLIFYRLQL